MTANMRFLLMTRTGPPGGRWTEHTTLAEARQAKAEHGGEIWKMSEYINEEAGTRSAIMELLEN